MKFELTGELPKGTTILEASAGTGKTYAIVGLATRYVAEGVADLSQLLLVTFSIAATNELRERTRERLTRTEAALADPIIAAASDDELVAYLAQGGPDKTATHRRRLRKALSDFDAATIATTHSFCQRMLDALGIAGEREPHANFVESIDDLVSEVVDDLYIRNFSGPVPPLLSVDQARGVARAALVDRHALLAPDSPSNTEAGQRVAFATAVRAEVERRKRATSTRDFDDLLVLLRDRLTDAEHGDAACERVRERYRVVLVDEFQDTDPIQWDILRRAFHGTTTLVLVGDPKQAIYAFRGAEVSSYLAAAKVADNHLELTTNWRSDAGLIEALDHLYGGAALGDSAIVVHPVTASITESRVPTLKPLRLRHVPRAGSGRLGSSGFPTVEALRKRVADDVAADIVALLDSGALLEVDGIARPVQPRDIAVLVRRLTHLDFVVDALDRAGIPSVLASGTSVFATEGAVEWLRVLAALVQPHRSDCVRLAALTPLLGYTAAQLDSGGDDVVAEVSGELREWAGLFAESGFAALFERLSSHTRLDARLLATESGERLLTDLRHVAYLCNRACVEESLGLTALTRWLTERIKDPAPSGIRDRTRRLDSEAAAVHIATIHSSKGLEFPIVYVPFGWDAAKNPTPSSILCHDDEGNRILDVGGQYGPGYRERQRRNGIEEAGEELRLLYVALTRAMCQVVAWWAPAHSTALSPLHRLLLGRMPGVAEPESRIVVPEDATAERKLTAWGATAGEVIAVEPVGTPTAPVVWQPERAARTELAAAQFDRTLDPEWRRTSYSALTRSVHETPQVGSEVERPEKTDEPEEEPLVELSPGGLPSPLNGFPAGAAFGTLVHEVLESVDTSTTDLASELVTRCTEVVALRLADIDPAALGAALLPVMDTPLGFGTLGAIATRDRLAELDFELPLAGGDTPAATVVTLQRVAELLRKHLPADDALAPYADLLHTVESTPLRGFLSGSIDAVLRVGGPRFVVVDYKTNRLGQGDLTVEHYTRARMAEEMLRAHYPLQALLYAVALHRYLRWRLPGYDPASHLGGVQYLFVRGMVGPETPPGCGVFDWNPPATLVVELSDLLAGS
ncbi:UvrD-helicase domain-containing protein [Antrihabitans stalactiti]|uniref:RecBCD enzyme subunit RecB n=1 Tax=Antrihabitans stalactiti TaxID=2584121 RepID=A0A848K839_9NOCA|nr:UvrD-helicase domain-containing protein [Antrihabitans stalactiti]NMN94509.1 AAA family ATPase [Antrihabitans stalactiti]